MAPRAASGTSLAATPTQPPLRLGGRELVALDRRPPCVYVDRQRDPPAASRDTADRRAGAPRATGQVRLSKLQPEGASKSFEAGARRHSAPPKIQCDIFTLSHAFYDPHVGAVGAGRARPEPVGLVAEGALGHESLAALEPDAHFAGLVSGFDVNDARPAAYGAVFGVRLVVAAPGVDVQLVLFSAEGARDRARAGPVAAARAAS